MANTKTNILKLTLATDLTTLFTEWITILNNNNVIIDSEAGNFRNAIAMANQQIQEIINNLLNYYTKTEIDNNFYTKDNVYAKTETYNKDEVYNTEQTYTKTEINDLIGTIARLEIKVVDTVEEVTEAGYIYLVPKESKDQKDVFDEYIFYNNKIELIGTTQIDLSNYYTKYEVDNLLKDKANAETVYNKAEVDTLLIDKANSSDVYTKNEIDLKVNKEETQNALNKSLYNLGAFDTISGNVITRQTGYVDLGSLNWTHTTQSGSDFYYTSDIQTYAFKGSGIKVVAQYYEGVNQNTIYNLGAEQCSIDNDGLLQFRTSGGTPKGLAQYKLATSYTEEIIEGQPLITLDSQGSQWLRSEWEKGINLFDYETRVVGQGLIWNTGATYDNTDYWTSDYIKAKPNITYTISGNTYNGVCYYNSNKTFISGIPTASSGSCFTTPTNTEYIRIASQVSATQVMLVEGSHAYPYQPYNSKAHITNYEAYFLKEESLKSANLLQNTNVQSYDLNFLENNISYTLSFSLSMSIGVTLVDGTSNVVDRGLSSGYYSFTFIKNSGGNASLWFSDASKVSNLMLNKGTEALPYQEYNGQTVHEKQLKELEDKIGDISAILDILNGEVL